MLFLYTLFCTCYFFPHLSLLQSQARFVFLQFETHLTLLQCIPCETLWFSESSFKLHFKMSHSNQARVFECSVCPKAFAKKYSLKVHRKAAQHYTIDDMFAPKTKRFECPYCDFQDDFESTVKHHIDIAHQYLRKPFNSISSNVPHTFFTVVPKFECPFKLCKTKTYSKDTMRSHFLKVHNSQESFELYLQSCVSPCIYCKTDVLNRHFKKHTEWCKNIDR